VGVEPTRPKSPRSERGASTSSTTGVWCARRDSNPHAAVGTGPSDRRVYRFTTSAYIEEAGEGLEPSISGL
jgi:hypothetical protein